MAGALTISTLNNDTGVLATQNGMTGIAKAWVNFDGTGTPSIRGSFNVSSITDNGTGDYTVNFTTAMPNANYSLVGSSRNGTTRQTIFTISTSVATPLTTSSARVNTRADDGAANDCDIVCASVFSS
jgi:hypothetical protein